MKADWIGLPIGIVHRPIRWSLHCGIVLCVIFVTLAGCSRRAPPSPDGAAAIGNTSDPQWVIQATPHAKVAVVFVHGIFGDTLGTWTAPNGSTFFKLLSGDSTVGKKVDMFAFGFTSNMFRGGSFDIQEAADRLQERLLFHGLLDYQQIVFVGHSMGGLVILKELLTHREMLQRVPLIVFYSTPQTGAQIAAIATLVARNPALNQMFPADKDGYLRSMSSEWKSIKERRPHITCAYEKRPTYGVLVVPWSSATYFCDEAANAIDADHIGIVKPTRAQDDAVVVLVNALNQYAVGEKFSGKLETPDFTAEGDHVVFPIGTPSGYHFARLINSGARDLSYTLGGNSDPDGLHLWPDDTPKPLAGGGGQAAIKVAFGMEVNPSSQYHFVLGSDVSTPETVFVKVADWSVIEKQRTEQARAVLNKLNALLADTKRTSRWNEAGPDSTEAPDAIVDTVHAAVAESNPEAPPAAQWVSSADLLNAVNWSPLAVKALRKLEIAVPAEAHGPNAAQLSASVSRRSGETRIFATNTAVPETRVTALAVRKQIFTTPSLAGLSSHVAAQMQTTAPVRYYGLSLQGDLNWERGNIEAAQSLYAQAAQIHPDPSISFRLKAVSEQIAQRIRPPQPPPVPLPTTPAASASARCVSVEGVTFEMNLAAGYSAGAEQPVRELDVTNHSGPAASIGKVLTTGPNSKDLTILKDECSKVTLQPRQSCKVVVQCAGGPKSDVRVEFPYTVGEKAQEPRRFDWSSACILRPHPPQSVCIGALTRWTMFERLFT